MSFSGQSGAIYFGPQSAKGVIATTFYRYPATDIDFDAISPGGVLPPEIAGILTPRGAYKMGVFAAGGFSFIPRLDNDLGWLLLGLFGDTNAHPANCAAIMDWTTVSDTDLDTDATSWNDSDGEITQPPTPRQISITAGDANASDLYFVIYGTLPGGQVIQESRSVSAGGDSNSTQNAFASITKIDMTAIDEVGTFSVGWSTYARTSTEAVIGWTEGTGADQAITSGFNKQYFEVPIQLIGALSCDDSDVDSDWTLTVAGTDANGASISETLQPSAASRGTGLSVLSFKSVTSVTLDSDFDSDQYGGVGYAVQEMYAHAFTYGADQEVIDWMTIRKVIPGDTDYFCEVLDCKLAMARFIVPQAGPVAARIDAVGRVPSFPEDVQATWDSEADPDDDPDAFPIANATGFFKITDKEGNIDSLGVTGMIFEIVNLLTTPQEEMTVGSNYPDDFGVRGRAVTCRFVYRWKDPELCRQIMTGASSGSTAWTAQVFTTDIEAEVTTPGDATSIAGGGQPSALEAPHKLRFSAPRVEFRQNGPLRLVGNQTIAVEFIGSVLTPEGSGQAYEGGDGDYFVAELWNQRNGYTWP